MDIKPILGYDELRSMLMVGHEYVHEKRFLDTAEEYKKALQNLFKSLLHHLMSGKIRVRRKTN